MKDRFIPPVTKMLTMVVLAGAFVSVPLSTEAQTSNDLSNSIGFGNTSSGGSAGTVAGGVAGGVAGAATSCGSLLATRLIGTAAGAPAGAAASASTIATGIPVHDLANIATQLAVTNGQGTQDVLKCALDSLAWTIGKVAVQSITRSTVNWINSGFNGSPAFVTDLQQNLNVLSDTVANNFFQQLNTATVGATGFNLTSPFQDQVTQQLRANYYKETGSLLGGNQYNLSNYSSNPQAFLNGNFSQGGFNAFFSANSNPANNPFGAYLLASNALWSQIDAATAQRKSELDWGKGFLSWRGNCTPAKQQGTPTTQQQESNEIAGLDSAGLPAGSVTSTNLAQTDACAGSPVKTPGSVVESQLEGVLGSGVQQLDLADSMNEIVSALFGQLVNQVLGSGGLSGVSQPASGGGSSYLSQATSPTQYSSQFSSLASGVTQNISNDLTTLQTYQANWQKILDAANAAQKACGTKSSIAAVVTQATAGVAKANTALQQETALSKSIQSTAANTTDPTQITTAITQYQSFLGAGTTPSATDEAYAAAQSADTGTATPPSLYTQMVQAQTSCPVT